MRACGLAAGESVLLGCCSYLLNILMLSFSLVTPGFALDTSGSGKRANSNDRSCRRSPKTYIIIQT